jgi:hypothetical protein
LLGGTESVTALSAHPASNPTAIRGIQYDAGASGLCSLELTTPIVGLDRDSVLLINASEYVRVLSVTAGTAGQNNYSIRCSMAGTHAVGESVAAVPTFRAVTESAHVAGEPITSAYMDFTVATGSGQAGLAIAPPANLTVAGLAQRAITLDDYMHVSVSLDAPESLTSLTLQIFTTASSTSPDAGLFTIDILPLIAGRTGWVELLFPIRTMAFIGGDASRSLSSVSDLQINAVATGAVHLLIGSWSVQGGYGATVPADSLSGLYYRFRYRSSITGAKSIPSPATRYGLYPDRALVEVTVQPSTDPQVDLIDIERFGGGSNVWHQVGTVANGVVVFNDEQTLVAIQANPALETDVYQPFPIQGLPFGPGAVDVVGTSVRRNSGPAFDTRWAPGTLLVVGQNVFTLYSQPTDGDNLQIVESAGVQTGVQFLVQSPTILGQPLGKMWGPIGGTTATFNFACGDGINPGRQYFTKGNDPDAAPDTSFIDITSPSEPLLNGFIWKNQSYVWTGMRLFALRPQLQGAGNLFVPIETGVGVGLLADWAFCTGPSVWYLGHDGIYETDCNTAVNITDDDLYPLFPHGNQTAFAVAVRGVIYYPPDLTRIADLRLIYHKEYVIFDYVDTAGARRSLFYRTIDKSWWPDTYTPGLTCHFSVSRTGMNNIEGLIAGTTNGFVALQAGASDFGANIPARAVTASYNFGDFRAEKQIGDTAIQGIFNNETISVVPLFNEGNTALVAQLVTGGVNIQQVFLDFNNGAGQLARDIALDFTWNSSQPISLYTWTPSLIAKVEAALKRATDRTDLGYAGRKHIRTLRVQFDSYGLAKNFQVLRDQGQLGTTIGPIIGQGEQAIPIALQPPIDAEMIWLQPIDSNPWRLMGLDAVYDRYPELSASYTSVMLAGIPGDKWVQGVRLVADTAGETVQVRVKYDGGQDGPLLEVRTFGKQSIPFSWTPFIAHTIELVPVDVTDSISIFESETEVVWEPMPELATIWKAQPTTFDLDGFLHLRDGYVGLISNGPVSLVFKTEGADIVQPFDSTFGVYQKLYWSAPPNKSRFYTPELTSDQPFRLFLRDCEVRVKQWGSAGPYQTVKPFGDVSRTKGGVTI